jgi:hypothetical protein
LFHAWSLVVDQKGMSSVSMPPSICGSSYWIVPGG